MADSNLRIFGELEIFFAYKAPHLKLLLGFALSLAHMLRGVLKL